MTSRVQPSTLQTFNNDLVKNLERLREQREDLDKEIEHGQTRQNELQNHMLVLQQQLDETTQSLIKRQSLRREYDRLINDTESAYEKIVESSRTVLECLQREAEQIEISRIS